MGNNSSTPQSVPPPSPAAATPPRQRTAGTPSANTPAPTTPQRGGTAEQTQATPQHQSQDDTQASSPPAPPSPWKRQWPPADATTQSPAAAATTPQDARLWREEMDKGNAQYAAAKKRLADGEHHCVNHVKASLRHYNEALRLAAGNAALSSSTHKNMLLSCGLGATDTNALADVRHYCLNEALQSAGQAVALGIRGGKDAEWVGVVIDAVFHMVTATVVDASNVASTHRGGVLQLLSTQAHHPTTQPHVKLIAALALLDRANKKGAGALDDHDNMRAVNIIDERRDLLVSSTEWAQRSDCAGFKDSVAEVADALRNTRTLGCAKRHLVEGKRLREKSVSDGIDMDLVFQALDELRAGVTECHELHVDVEAELLSEMGYILLNILKCTDAAHNAYRACLLCAHACFPREFTGHAWFKRARDAEEALQSAIATAAQQQRDALDAPFKKEIAPEVAKLKANDTSIAAVLKYIATTYPGPTPFKAYDAKLHTDGEDKYYQALLKKILVKFHDDKSVNEPRKVQLLHREISLVLTHHINVAKELA